MDHALMKRNKLTIDLDHWHRYGLFRDGKGNKGKLLNGRIYIRTLFPRHYDDNLKSLASQPVECAAGKKKQLITI